MKYTRCLLNVLLALTVVGCSPTGTVDLTDADAETKSFDDAGTCRAPNVFTSEIGETGYFSVKTRETESVSLCEDISSDVVWHEGVIKYTVPGEPHMRMKMHLHAVGLGQYFFPTIRVSEKCESSNYVTLVPNGPEEPEYDIDDVECIYSSIDNDGSRAIGEVIAMGGDDIYIVVGGTESARIELAGIEPTELDRESLLKVTATED